MTKLLVGLAFSLAVLAAAPADAGTPAAGFTDTLYAGGFSTPVAIAFLPDGRLIVVEKGGFSGAVNAAVKLFDPSGPSTTTLGTIPVCAGGEQGLLGVAIDPNFAVNGFVYLYRTESQPTNTNAECSSATGRSNEVIRVTVSGGTIGSLAVLLTGIRTDNGNHNGGTLRYNPADGKLYVSVGDTGLGDNFGCPGDPTNPYARDDNSLEGKILRLNLDGTIPADNPFFGQAGKRGEIFALGFRNPFRVGFDPVTDNLWVGDVGDLAYEEINIVTAGDLTGPDYGWPDCEGTQPAGCPIAGTTAPIFTYSHNGMNALCPQPMDSLGVSITGGAFAGAAFGTLADDYVFADFASNTVYLATVNGPRDDIVGTPTTISTGAQGPVDVVRGPDGAIYYVAINGNSVRRMTAVALPDDEPLFGKSLLLKDDADATKKRVVALAKDVVDLGDGNGSADDPVLNGGSLRILTADGCGGPCDDTYALPTGGWGYIGQAGDNKGYRFRDTTGPIRTVIVRAGRRIRVVGRATSSPLGHNLAADPQPVDVVLSLGTTPHRYCMEYGGLTTFTADTRFKATNANAPALCP
jgi:glucose/arabinose dehydrogenase